MQTKTTLWIVSIVVLFALGLCTAIALYVVLKPHPGIGPGGSYSVTFGLVAPGPGVSVTDDDVLRVMAVLEKRVDPDGHLNLAWRAIENGHIEVLVPRPSGEILRYQEAYQQALAAIQQSGLSEREIRRILDSRDASVLDRDVTEFLKLSRDLIAAHDGWIQRKGPWCDPADLIRLMRGAGVLEFRILAERQNDALEKIDSSVQEVHGNPIKKYVDQLQLHGRDPQEGDRLAWLEIAEMGEREWENNRYIIEEHAEARYILAYDIDEMAMLHEWPATWSLRIAQRDRDQAGRLAVRFSLDSRGGVKFGDLTGRNRSRPLCIFLDDRAITAANIQSQIFESGIITGNFTEEDVRYLVNTLNAGVAFLSIDEDSIQVKIVPYGEIE